MTGQDSSSPNPVEGRLATALAERGAAHPPTVPSLDELHAAALRTPAPSRRAPGGRLVAVAAAVAVAVVGGGTTFALTRPDDPAATSSVAGAPTIDARDLLNRIAMVAEQTDLTAPRADQYVYTRNVDAVMAPLTDESRPPVRDTGETSTRETWLPEDVTRDGFTRRTGLEYVSNGSTRPRFSGRLVDADARQPGSAPRSYAGLSQVPTDDPADLLAIVEGYGPPLEQVGDDETAASLTVLNVGELIDSRILPPDLAAALYRALGTVPGVTAETGVTDLLGRTGVGVGAVDRHGERREIIFDERTLAPLGLNSYLTVDGPRGRTGDRTSATAFGRRAVVDEAEQTPPG